jgi:hypothetical protein
LEVIGFPVVGYPQIFLGVAHRHVSRRRKVNDTQTVRTKADVIQGNHPVVIRTPMSLKVAHPADDPRVIFFAALSL